MKALVQRVSCARVLVSEDVVGEISKGLLVFLAVEKEDSIETAAKLRDKLLNYRIFSDEKDKMNLSLKDTAGDLLIVSQFTLAANTSKGRRPSFDGAALPEKAQDLYLGFVELCKEQIGRVETGEFGANMQVELTNDGPVTFMLEIK